LFGLEGEMFLTASRLMLLKNHTPEQRRLREDAFWICITLAGVFAYAEIPATERLIVRKMVDAAAPMREPRDGEHRAVYARALMVTKEAARAVQGCAQADSRRRVASHLIIQLVAIFDPRFVRASKRVGEVVSALERYDPKANGARGRWKEKRVLAEIIVLAGGLDRPKATAEMWARNIGTVLASPK